MKLLKRLLNTRSTTENLYFTILITAFFKQFYDLLKGGATYDIFEQWLGAGYIFSKIQAIIDLDFGNTIFSNNLNYYDYFGYFFMLPAYIFERFINGFSYNESNLPSTSFALYFSSEDAQTFFIIHFCLLIYSFICLHIIYKKLTFLFDINYAVLFILIILFVPSFTGHMLFNVKDIPFLLNLFIAKLYIIENFYHKDINDLDAKDLIKISFIISFTLLIRVNSILFISFLFFFLIFPNKKNLNLFFKKILTVLTGAVVLLIVFSPSSWQDPIYWVKETILFQFKHPWTGATLTNGEFIYAQDMIGSYLINWYFYKMPIFIHLFFLIYLIFFKKNKNFFEIYSFIFLVTNFLLFAFLKPTAYDGLRHFLFLIPYFVVTCVSALSQIMKMNKQFYKIVVVIFLIYGTTTQIGLNSYRYAYFNELTDLQKVSILCGDVDGCGDWPTDYWGFSGKELTKKLNKHYQGIDLLVCEPRHVFSEYLESENFRRIEFKDVIGVDTFYTLSLHRPRQFDSSCEFHEADYKITCKPVDVVSRELRGTSIIMSYINKCSAEV